MGMRPRRIIVALSVRRLDGQVSQVSPVSSDEPLPVLGKPGLSAVTQKASVQLAEALVLSAGLQAPCSFER